MTARQASLRKALASLEAARSVPALHPNLARIYREKVAALAEALSGEDGAAAREQVRELVEEIRLIPEDGSLRVEVRGALAAILALGAGNAKSPSAVAGALVSQIKGDAGTGFGLYRTRLEIA